MNTDRRSRPRRIVAKVNLHLTPWIDSEPNQRLWLGHRSQRRQVILEDAVSARITEAPQFTQQHGRRNPVWRGGLYPFFEVMLVGIKLARSRFTLVPR